MFKETGKTGKTHDMDRNVSVRDVCCDHSVLGKGHKKIKASLDHLANRLTLIERSSQVVDKKEYQNELVRMIHRVHMIEVEIEGIKDPLVRAFGYEFIDRLATKRRFLMEEVRWDIASC